MSREYTLNGYAVPDEDVLSYDKQDVSVDFNGTFSVASKFEVTLDDTDKDSYNPFYSGSLFYGVDWWNTDLDVYDSDIEGYAFRGRIKKIAVSDRNSAIKVTGSNVMQDLIETVCVYDNTAGGNETPAEAVKNILTTAMGLDEATYIDDGSFQEAIDIQTTETAWVDVVFTKDDGKKCKAVIQELCRMSRCSFYCENEKFYLIQYQDWNGQIGTEIDDDDIQERNFEIDTVEDQLINDYVVKYDNSGTIATATGSDASSQSTYDLVRTFLVPKDSKDETSSSDYKILYANSAGAGWAGDLMLDENKNIKYKITFQLDNSSGRWEELRLFEQLDLSFAYFSREPVKIIKLARDRDKRTITVSAYFLNLPINVAVRDSTPPEPVELISVDGVDEGVLVKWTQSQEADHVGYEVFITSTKGEWKNEFCHLGRSPIDVKNPSTVDGYAYTYLRQLNNGTEYHVKVKSYDTRFNKSAFSNSLSGTPSA